MLEKLKQRRDEGSIVSMLIKYGKYINRLADYMTGIPFVEQVHQNEISNLIDICYKYKYILFNVLCIKGEYYREKVDKDIVEKLENMNITDLQDCKIAGNYIYEIGKSLRENMDFLFAPFISRPIYISFLDFFIITLIPLALYFIITL
ncbi:MAG: hypothetical protein QME45_12415 [Clostridiales bacterium]|nr:hypothetical protein [Clostridiales bacterium]